MSNHYEIIKKKHEDGEAFFIKDFFSILNGPYKTLEEAEADVPQSGDLQYPLNFSSGWDHGGINE